MTEALAGKRIAVPETRQLDVLARLLEKKGADVLRCPLVSIHDSPDEETVVAWLQRFIDSPPDDFIILTGEGIRRLAGFAERHGLLEDWKCALAKARKIARGPKPGKALRELDLRVDLLGQQPTTDGIIETLQGLELSGRRLAVQLYGTDPNQKLMDYLASRNIAPDCVAPYIYASEAESDAVASLIQDMANGDVDMICFTSQPQLKRLQQVAKKQNLPLSDAMANTRVAAVGPIMGSLLREEGFVVAVEPEQSFFMGDLINAIVKNVQQAEA